MAWHPPQHETGTRLRDALPETGWREAVVEILSRHHLPAHDLHPFSTGSDVVFGTPEHVVKLTHPRWADEAGAEWRGLELAGGLEGIHAPRPVARGDLAGWPYVVMTRIPGRPLAAVWNGLDDEARVVLGGDLGRLLRALHDVTVEPDPAWPAFLERMRDRAVAGHRDLGAPAVWTDRAAAFLEEAWPPPEVPQVFLHTEVLNEHVFVDGRDGAWRVSGLLDFADSRVGHPGYEFPALAEFIFRGHAPAFRACLDAYGFPGEETGPVLSRRLLLWSLVHQFGSLPRMLEAVGDPEPAGIEDLAARLYPCA